MSAVLFLPSSSRALRGALGVLLLATPAAARAATATYSDPVPAELLAYSSFPVNAALDTAPSGLRTIRYELPADLVGAPFAIRLDEQPSAAAVTGLSVPFDGPLASAVCNVRGDASILCVVSYKHAAEVEFGQRLDSTLAYLNDSVPDGLARSQKRAVAQLFSTEPAGFLFVDPAATATP
jgi:hypothetical protein